MATIYNIEVLRETKPKYLTLLGFTQVQFLDIKKKTSVPNPHQRSWTHCNKISNKLHIEIAI